MIFPKCHALQSVHLNIYLLPLLSDMFLQKIVGYCKDPVREVVVWVCTILTVGILRLVFYWRPDWMLKCTCVMESLDKAEYVLLEVWSCLRCKA